MIYNKLIAFFSILILFIVFIYIFLYGHYSNCKTFVDHIYFCINSITFTGHGDIVPITQISKLATSAFVLLIFYIVLLT
jgi:hypothetical protein